MRSATALLPRHNRLIAMGALLLGLLFLLPPAWAAVDREQAAAIAQRVTPGRVLAVERGVHVDGTIVWRIQVLTKAGEVRMVVIDAETGRSR
ncbi:MAG TPA: PepSY domain-containing protein [Ramlibacter sp.]|uniref:PepSY domain-containing protein n=1 Tax=Ramlibacter sp. TaxID=1917967 RepID=UPI002D7E5AC3|nr:PepSY domain-containing protein [Ramlibacter sp.]HET8747984.1 PepSY domain-containing protein [Ramlibacter sp.]